MHFAGKCSSIFRIPVFMVTVWCFCIILILWQSSSRQLIAKLSASGREPKAFPKIAHKNSTWKWSDVLLGNKLEEFLDKTHFEEEISNFSHRVSWNNSLKATMGRMSTLELLNSKNSYAIGDNLCVTIQAKDSHGNLKLYGGDYFRARMYSDTLKASVNPDKIIDRNNGSYDVYFTVRWSGRTMISVMLVHAVEAIAVIKRVISLLPNRLVYNGIFQAPWNAMRTENSRCDVITPQGTVCNYSDSRYDAPFYCKKPAKLECNHLKVIMCDDKSSLLRMRKYVTFDEEKVLKREPNDMNAVIALCHFCELHGPRILFSTQAYHQGLKDGVHSQEKFRGRAGTLGSTSSLSSERSERGAAGSQRTELCEACRSIQQGHSGFISHDNDVGVSYTSTQYPAQPQIFTMVRQACIRSLSCEVCPGREGPIFFGDEHYGYTLSYTFFVKDSQARGFQRWYSIIVVMTDRTFLLNSWPFLTSNIQSIIQKIQAQALSIYETEQQAKSQRAERINRQLHAPQKLFLRRGGGSQVFRSLIELTGDKQLFRYLHMLFSWILMAGGSRLTEKVLEGPPNEEAFIDFASEEETEEGFIKVTTKLPDSGKDEEELTATAEISYADGGPTFRSLSHFRKVIGSINFHDLAYHIVTGNQVIVRSQCKSTLKSVFDVLKTLLPSSIGTAIVFSKKYEESWKCNFLGLSLDTGIPDYVLSSELYIALDIIPAERNPTNYTKILVDSSDPFYGYGIVIKSSATVPDKVPTFQSRVENMMDNSNLDENVVSTFLQAVKQEWMNKVKMLFKFTRAGSHTEEETHRLLKILQAGKEDEPLLKYWKMGLSSQYKSHLLTESMGLDSHSGQ